MPPSSSSAVRSRSEPSAPCDNSRAARAPGWPMRAAETLVTWQSEDSVWPISGQRRDHAEVANVLRVEHQAMLDSRRGDERVGDEQAVTQEERSHQIVRPLRDC